MSGQTDVTTLSIFFLSIVASVTDIARGRVFNWLTLPMALAALLFSLITSGASGFAHSLLGLGLGLLLYGWMFWMGVLGGGDVKLLMAFGAWGGVHYVQDVAVLGVLLGAVLAVVMLAFQGHLVTFLKKLYRFILTLMSKDLQIEPIQVNKKLTMPFGVPISAAAVWVQLSNPLAHWGMHL